MNELIGRHTTQAISDEQIEAILAMDSHVIIAAGPGSGKTGVLSSHIKALITPQETVGAVCPPNRIIAITFTRRAASEIRARLHGNDPTAGWNQARKEENGFIGTHHAFLLWLCNNFRAHLGFPKTIPHLTLLDKRSEQKYIDACRHKALHDFSQEHMLFKELTPEYIEERGQEIWRLKRLENGLLTFDDLDRFVHRILDDPNLYSTLEKAGFYLHIDEAQDLGPAEYVFYNKFPARQKYIVGDPAQAIYGFQDRGESLLNQFMRRPGIRRLRLTNNYRSFQPIITAAHQLMLHHRPELGITPQKSMRTASRPGAPMVLQWSTIDEQDQMKLLIRLIRHYAQISPGRHHWNQIAIIYRNSGEGKQIEALLKHCHIRTRTETTEDDYRKKTAPEQNAVTLALASQAKGMEYPNVFIPYATDEVWPGELDPNRARRLLYCAMSRAQNTVHFLYHEATERDYYLIGDGNRPRTKVRPSRFLEEMNEPNYVATINTTSESEENG
jgi:DNA helicase-2/ATP-dependent DNA helicase PcrA